MKKLLVLLVSVLGLTSCSKEDMYEKPKEQQYYLEVSSHANGENISIETIIIDNETSKIITKLKITPLTQYNNNCEFYTNSKSITLQVNGLVENKNKSYVLISKYPKGGNGTMIDMFMDFVTENNSTKIISLE